MTQNQKNQQKEEIEANTKECCLQDNENHFIGQYHVAPKYMKGNQHITHGYRINFTTTKKIVKSLFMVHNQSVNIWTHCIPAFFIIFFFVSAFFIIDTEIMKNSFKSYHDEIKHSMDNYMNAIHNLSLISQYDQLQKKTKKEIEGLKQTAINRYYEFYDIFQKNSAEISNNLQQSMKGIKQTMKQNIRNNFAQFERVKKEFERNIAPMIISQFNSKLNNSWFQDFKLAAEKIKHKLDSTHFQYLEFHEEMPNPQEISRWPIFVFLSTALFCLLSSSIFHLVYPMSAKIYTITNRFDYAGINVLIAGSSFPPVYYGMYCNIDVAIIYLSIAILLAIICFTVCLFQWIHLPEHGKYKASLFAGFGMSMAIPSIHMIINESLYDNYGDSFTFITALPFLILLGASYLGGLYVYTVRCPERYHPGKYNVCGQSHQIWHVMVVLGIIFTYMMALETYEMRKSCMCPSLL